jgi:hypothetical protein
MGRIHESVHIAVGRTMSRLDPQKLHVRFVAPASEDEPITPRCYTLTHSDRTGDLFLTIGSEHNRKQIAGWYTRLMHDEVLAEFSPHGEGCSLHVHCQVGHGLGSAKYREAIFRQELPLVFEAFRFGDGRLFLGHPYLDSAPVFVHYHGRRAENDLVEDRGEIRRYSL